MPAFIVETFGTAATLMFTVTAPVQRATFNFSVVPRALDVAPTPQSSGESGEGRAPGEDLAAEVMQGQREAFLRVDR